MSAEPDSEFDGIALANVAKSYGAVQAVRGVDIAIPRGQTMALLGPNGAGKSTTLDMVLGLQRPDSGSISVFGQAPGTAVEQGRVAAMLQTGALVNDLSVRELVELMAALYPNPLPVDEVLARTGLTDVAKRRTQKLSGGQVQRVRFAATLASNADLLVLDEPTVALDVEGRRAFWEAMRGVAATGKTIVFATHYLEEADAYADRIVLLAAGQVVADGPATKIKAMVGGRTIRATLADVDTAELAALPGVTSAVRHGDAVELACSDSDAALRALLQRHPAAHDLEVRGAGLEAAFLELTADAATNGGDR